MVRYKRVTALLLAILMLFFALPAYADAENGSVPAYEYDEPAVEEVTETPVEDSSASDGDASVFAVDEGPDFALFTLSGDEAPAKDESGAYQISGAEELKWFADAVNSGDVSACAVLTDSIDVTLLGTEWTPIGTVSAPYEGTFSGGGYAVNLNGSLFGVIDGAHIEELKVTGTASGGGVAQTVKGNSVVSGCVSYVTVSARSGAAGGIVGSAADSARVENCVNYGAVSGAGTDGTGGIAGKIAGSASITDCFNYGEVSSSALGIGGVVGQHGSSGAVSQCANCGSVYYNGSVTNLSAYAVLGVGGVVGYVSAGGVVDSCCNSGDVTSAVSNLYGNNYSYYAGGVVGNGGSGGCTVSNCYNSGSVSVTADSGFTSNSGSAYAGGVMGCGAGTVVTNCFNVGGVSAQANAGSAEAHSITGVGGSAVNCWYLDGCAEDEQGTAVSEAELAELAPRLGSAFKSGSKYPLLAWQEDDGGELPGPGDEDTQKRVTVTVAPISASFVLTDSEGTVIDPESRPVPGRYVYLLNADGEYTYSAVLEGYYDEAGMLTAGDTLLSISLTVDERIAANDGGVIYGGGNAGRPNTISSGGTYTIGEGATGILKIETAEKVVLTGAAGTLKDLYIKCTVPGADLTLKDVYISDSAKANIIDFTGTGNFLYFSGTSLLEQNGNIMGYAAIHVPAGAELTIGGVTADDTLYMYKEEQGAGIGGNGASLTPEYNGKITFTQGKLFIKGTKQGALIGAGANASSSSGSPSEIIIQGGELTLLANARGAAIGGAAGSSGASVGTKVYMYNGTLTINVDFSGAAIGGGGYDKGNDQKNGGTLYYFGGSIRTYIDKNAVVNGLWNVADAGVNGNIGITASICNGSGANKLYLCQLDTEELGIEGDSFAVYDGENLIYTGGLHRYDYINSNSYKQIIGLPADETWQNITDTRSNWGDSGDTCLYVYLTGETHALTVNDVELTAEWDGTGFFVHLANTKLLEPPELTGAIEIGIKSIILTPPAASAIEAEAVPEYRVSGDGGKTWSEWQESPEFTGLKADTAYCFQARYRAADALLYASSLAGNTLVVKTLADPNAFGYEAEASGRTVTASVYGTSVADAVDDYGVLSAYLVTGRSGITQVETVISCDTLYAMAESGEVYAFELETDLGLIRFDYRMIRNIAAEAGEYDAVLTIIKYSDTEYSFRMSINSRSILTSAGSGTAYIELPYSRQDDKKSVLVYDEEEKELEAEYMPRAEIIAFYVNRLTDITIKEAAKGDPYADVWDGLSLDVSWFTPGKSSYYISTPAQLMGLAALVNGIYNDEITTIVGEESYIVDNVSSGGDSEDSSGGNQSTDTYHYGSYDFTGATVYLTADLDMGGSEGANYMPIGGQYLMSANDYETKISSSFCGVFDGDGHTVSNIYCDRYCSTNYGDGSSVGLIGRLGVHDNDPVSTRPSGAAVRNVAVEGYFYANRSVGGIVGKIGKSSGGVTIESCANYATVVSTDTKGCGGIVGAGWNGGIIRNCYNAGTVQSYYSNPTAGISGSNEVTLENCYNVGSISAGSASFAMALGTNNGGAPYSSYVLNCWYLRGSAPGGGYYSGSTVYNDGALTSDYMKTAEFVETLGNAFAMDTAGINDGYPVLSWQEQAKAGVEIKSTTTVKNGVATTSVTEKDVSASVAAARKEDVDTLLIITDTEGKSVDKTVVEIPRSSVGEIGNAKLSLTVETADGSRVTMTDELLTSAAGKAKGDTVELSVTPQTSAYAKELLDRTEEYENTYLGGSVTVSIALSSGGAELAGFMTDFSMEIPVNKDEYQSGTAYDVLQVLGDGTVNRLSGKCVSDGGQLYVVFNTSELGTFIVLSRGESIYDDVGPDDWFYEAVMFVTELGLMNGVGDGMFEPNGTMTRAMMVTVLYRMEGSPAVTEIGSFTDVADGTWYTDAVAWAAGAGIVEGYGNGTFGPTDEVTREQMAAILYRYAGNKGYDTDKTADLSRYTDSSEISAWAKRAMEWANGLELITGRTENTLTPGGSATRAEVATILMRFVRLFVQ